MTVIKEYLFILKTKLDLSKKKYFLTHLMKKKKKDCKIFNILWLLFINKKQIGKKNLEINKKQLSSI